MRHQCRHVGPIFNKDKLHGIFAINRDAVIDTARLGPRPRDMLQAQPHNLIITVWFGFNSPGHNNHAHPLFWALLSPRLSPRLSAAITNAHNIRVIGKHSVADDRVFCNPSNMSRLKNIRHCARHLFLILAVLAASMAAPAFSQTSSTVTAQTSDGVTLYGERYFGDLAADAPLILLFHQAGSNGRGEYGPLADWLNQNGYRAIAWDQRSGGKQFGSHNRTVDAISEDVPNGYCDAYADLQAALAHTLSNELAKEVIIWGSSYSAALVFRLAADNPDTVSALVAASPATGGPMAECRARQWVKMIDAPILTLRPGTEMSRESSREQRQKFEPLGVDFLVIADGVHGSSMLVDERTETAMQDARDQVMHWLNALAADEPETDLSSAD